MLASNNWKTAKQYEAGTLYLCEIFEGINETKLQEK